MALDNLQLRGAWHVEVPRSGGGGDGACDDDCEGGGPFVAFCLDGGGQEGPVAGGAGGGGAGGVDGGRMYALDASGALLCLEQHGRRLLWSVPLPLAPQQQQPGRPLVAALSYVVELEAVFIAAASGELLLLHTSGTSPLPPHHQHQHHHHQQQHGQQHGQQQAAAAGLEVEEVGVVQGGVAAAGWSPDGELLAVLGCSGLLLLMNKEWDVLAEVSVPPPAAAAAATAPPAAADGGGDGGADGTQQQQQQQPELLSASLTWRGDGQYLATNTLWRSSSSSGGGGGGSRALHIWEREDCQLHATGQDAPGLSAAIAWQPNSRHLFAAAALPPPPPAAAGAQQPLRAAPHQRVVSAAAKTAPSAAGAPSAGAPAAGQQQQQQQQQRQQPDTSWSQHIVLYERNGLQHGGFDVPSDADGPDAAISSSSSEGAPAVPQRPSLAIHSLHWSSDSRLLAVVLAPPAACGPQQEQELKKQQELGGWVPHQWRLQLWCRSNWHWYLKYEQLHDLPDAAGGLMACWDEALPTRLHLLSGAGRYARLDFGWAPCVSARGTAAVIDGHQLLLTPMRHGLVPPPMCAVRALLPRPAVALAWWDGDVSQDLDDESSLLPPQQHGHDHQQQLNGAPDGAGRAPNGLVQQQQLQQPNGAAATGPAPHQQQHRQQHDADSQSACAAASGADVDVLGLGLCEVLAVLLSDGSLAFLRAVESDLWEETLQDQAALGGPWDHLVPLGWRCPPVANGGDGGGAATSATPAAAAAAAASSAANEVEYYGGLSMPAGPWGARTGALPGSSAAGGDVQRLLDRPLAAAAAAGSSGGSNGGSDGAGIPLAEGRQPLGLVWAGPRTLLLLAAPLDDAAGGVEDGEGTVLVEVRVVLPRCLYAPAAAAAAGGGNKQQQELLHVEAAAVRTSYAGGAVLAAAAHPAGGAVLQLAGGRLLYYPGGGSDGGGDGSDGCDGRLPPLLPLQLPEPASFPAGCPTMLLLPGAPAPGADAPAGPHHGPPAAAAARVAAAAPALGLSPGGVLYWGGRVVARDVASVAVRGGGPGGPALLYVTRHNVLYMAMVWQLPRYTHTPPDESSGALTWRRRDYPGDLRAAISTAMRPSGAAAAARDPHMRAVEAGAALLCAPYGGPGVVLVMPRGNLEGVSPRLLVLAALCAALERGDYGAAWQLAVVNRVDLNLLVDYAWPRFLEAADTFVSHVCDPSDLCDLLLALSPSSILGPGGPYEGLRDMLGWQQQTQAQPPEQQQQQQQQQQQGGGGLAGAAAAAGATQAAGGSSSSGDGASGGGKVSAVCAALREAVLKLPGRFQAGHLKTVVMTYARSDPPSLEGALLAIRDVKEAAVAQQEAALPQQPPPPAPAAPAAVGSGAAAPPFAVTPADAAAAPPGALGAAADAALRHLLLYVDVDQLYRSALGLYDLALAFMVVSHSQKDPGEYLAELGRFGAQPDEHLRRHVIDMSLGRYDRALEDLAAAGPAHFGAALKLARERGLLRQLLALMQQEAARLQQQQAQQTQQQAQPRDEAQWRLQLLAGTGPPPPAAASAVAGGRDAAAAATSADEEDAAAAAAADVQRRLVAVLGAYGDALLGARKPEDAAVAYSAGGLMEQALGAYRTAGAWRMAMVLAARLGRTPQQQVDLARELAEQLLCSGAAADAGALLVQHVGDVDGGVAALAAGKEWREALRVSYAAGRGDLVDTVVVPAAAQAASVLLSDAGEAQERLAKYGARLREVRQRREAMAAALAAATSAAEGEAAAATAAGDHHHHLDDTASEAPSMVSGLSMYTDRTQLGGGTAGGGGSLSSSSSSAAPSTLGGRRAQKRDKKKKGRSAARKIRTGSPGEEAALQEHLLGLGPPRHVLEEAGQLCELLVLLGHGGDAARLQQRVGQWQAAAAAAAAELAGQGQQQQQHAQGAAGAAAAGAPPPPLPPAAAAAAGAAPQAAAAAAAAAPAAATVHWKWDVLREHKA